MSLSFYKISISLLHNLFKLGTERGILIRDSGSRKKDEE
jgi:hypothetical protein